MNQGNRTRYRARKPQPYQMGRDWRTRPARQSIVPDLYPLPEEFPAAAVARLLAVVRGAERDPRVIAHAVWHLAGYTLAVTKR